MYIYIYAHVYTSVYPMAQLGQLAQSVRVPSFASKASSSLRPWQTCARKQETQVAVGAVPNAAVASKEA